jgi:hypothetical protein
MCALATLDPPERMGQQHVHLASLANTNQLWDLLYARGVQLESFLLLLVQFRMCVLAILELLGQMGLEHVHCVMLVSTRQEQGLLYVLCVPAENFLW